MTPSTPSSSRLAHHRSSLTVQTERADRPVRGLEEPAVTIGIGPRGSVPGRSRRPDEACGRPALRRRYGNGTRAHRGAGPAAAESADPAKAQIGERADIEAVPACEPLEEGDERLDARIGLRIHVDARAPASAPTASRGGARVHRGRGTGSCAAVGREGEPASAASTSAICSEAIAPVRSVSPSRQASWKATTTPSRVTCASVSRKRYPMATAAANASSVFSGASSAPPR